MKPQPTSTKPSGNDEVDLGQFFQIIGNAINSFFRGLIYIFIFIRRHIIWLGSLVIVGLVLGYILKTIVVEEQKLDVMVVPMMENSDYLIKVVEEVQANIKAQDTAFFSTLGMDLSKMDGFDIELTPLRVAKAAEQDLDFIELLTEFGESGAADEVIREELMDQTTLDHILTFYFKDDAIGPEYAGKILDHINSNEYYNELNTVSRKNARQRLKRNDSLLAQIDLLIANFADRIERTGAIPSGSLTIENQEFVDIPSLMELKNQLIRDSEEKRLEIVKRKEAIRIMSFGKPHQVQKPLFGNLMVLLPTVFVGFFLFIALIRYLNRKADQLQQA